MLNVFPALIVLLVTLAIIRYLGRPVFAAILGAFKIKVSLKGSGEKRKLNKKIDLLESAKEEKSFVILRRAFYLDQVKHDIALIDRVHAHHLAILDLIISVSDEHGLRTPNLPEVESLLQERSMLMRKLVDIASTKTALKQRRKDKQKEVPEWATLEFSEKTKELTAELKDNRIALDHELEKLFDSLNKETDSEEMVIH